jgi:hypothetical protein
MQLQFFRVISGIRGKKFVTTIKKYLTLTDPNLSYPQSPYLQLHQALVLQKRRMKFNHQVTLYRIRTGLTGTLEDIFKIYVPEMVNAIFSSIYRDAALIS